MKPLRYFIAYFIAERKGFFMSAFAYGNHSFTYEGYPGKHWLEEEIKTMIRSKGRRVDNVIVTNISELSLEDYESYVKP